MKNISAFLLCTLLLTSCALPGLPDLIPGQNLPSATLPPPSLTPTETYTPVPTQRTATFTLTPTLVGFKTATFTPTPTFETPTPAFTNTPSVVIPSQVMDGFTLVTLSAREFYLGKCDPASVKFTAQVARPTEVLFVGLFVRLKSTVTGATSPWTSITMDNMGAGTFAHTLIPDEIKYLESFEETLDPIPICCHQKSWRRGGSHADLRRNASAEKLLIDCFTGSDYYPHAMTIEIPSDLIRFLRKAGRVVVLTGAGVSQESGLRTFRDPQTGLWAQYKPTDLASPEAFARDPKLVWDWYAWRREALKSVRPNAGHDALVEMEKNVPEFTLITQNVDNLHRFAGSRHILELHGNIQRVRCSECRTFTEEWGDDTESVPRCSLCGGLLRPDVVWFGENLPRAELEAAVQAARTCDVFFSVGTSGIVQPAASLAFAAHNKGAVVVEINAEPTPLTPKTDFFLPGKSGEILPELVKDVWK